jgi:hypothetical protein
MRTGRLVLAIVAALSALIGFGALAGGIALVAVHSTQRDSAGYYSSSTEHLQTATAALMARVNLRAPAWPSDWALDRPIGTVKVDARPATETPLFIGIGPAAAVDGWLAGTSYERITRADYRLARVETVLVAGPGSVSPPGEQTFWAATASGSGEQILTWPSARGEWAIVLMNADARPGVSADVSVGANLDVLLPVGIGLGAVGLLVLVASMVGLLAAVGATSTTPGTLAAATSGGRPGSYPVRLDARLEPDLSRWLWLVKWILVIPHWIVLALLWIAVIPLTAVSGFAILFTGRYPRAIFEFNAGVMRWTWRVSYYSFSALGTDRYPPFSLMPDPTYPADLSIDYPERLSRGLVLVKWWLLAIPHYLIVGLFASGWAGWYADDWRMNAGTGLIGILVLVAAVILAVSGSYPQQLFDFVMGMNRWCYRVLAYAALMRDEYPPFRLDNGGPDPGSLPSLPPTPPPTDRTEDLVGAVR